MIMLIQNTDPAEKEIEGWFSDTDAEVYRIAVSNANAADHFVEVGSYKGRSASVMLKLIAEKEKYINFDLVDNFSMGNTYKELIENLEPFASKYCLLTVVPYESSEAASLYADKSLGFVYIDADHDYEAVKKDILVYKPKIRSGGILAGHDFNHAPVARAVAELLGTVNLMGNSWWVRL